MILQSRAAVVAPARDTHAVRDRQYQMDRTVAKTVLSSLEQDTQVSAGQIWVAVHHGWVTLKGEVDWSWRRALVDAVVCGLPGVRGVTNPLTVATPVTTESDRPEITA